jgi:hypothetical protein
MASENLLQVLNAEAGEGFEELDESALDRVLIEPHQEALAEAIAADVVDVAPVAGDLLAAVRQRRAEEQGIEYEDQPVYIENALSDLPFPLDTVADIVVSQNVLRYLRVEHGIELADDVVRLNEQAIENFGTAIDTATPD